MIVIINGALGVGKTETAWKLLEHFERAVMLDGDTIGAVQPFEIYDEQRIEYLYQTLRQLGYTFIDYAQNTDRKFFRKGLPRTHHAHIVAANSPSMIEHLAFRDDKIGRAHV